MAEDRHMAAGTTTHSLRGRIGAFAQHARYDTKATTAAARAAFLSSSKRSIPMARSLCPSVTGVRLRGDGSTSPVYHLNEHCGCRQCPLNNGLSSLIELVTCRTRSRRFSGYT
jgi:hypothetical protein